MFEHSGKAYGDSGYTIVLAVIHWQEVFIRRTQTHSGCEVTSFWVLPHAAIAKTSCMWHHVHARSRHWPNALHENWNWRLAGQLLGTHLLIPRPAKAFYSSVLTSMPVFQNVNMWDTLQLELSRGWYRKLWQERKCHSPIQSLPGVRLNY